MGISRLLFASVLLLPAIGLWASPTGSVSGTVKDPSGALIPGVKLTLTNTETNAHLTTVTTSGGEFQFLQLAPANYSLVAESTGFKRATVSSVLVQVDQVTHVELALEARGLTILSESWAHPQATSWDLMRS